MKRLYIDTRKINVEYIVNELFDFSKIGGISILDVIPENARNDLIDTIKFARQYFWQAPKKEGLVNQEMQCFYVENLNEDSLDRTFITTINKFKEEYQEAYREIARLAFFETENFNSLGFHYYPINSLGISPHRDYARDRDLISIFVLKGNSPFYVCLDRNKRGLIKLESSPGSLILLRAARNKEEQRYRPFHYLEEIKEERLSLIIRRRIP